MQKGDQFATLDECNAKNCELDDCQASLAQAVQTFVDEIDTHYGDLILHTDVCQLSQGKILFRFQELLPETVEFLQHRGNLPQQLHVSQWQLCLVATHTLTTKPNDLNTKLQSENRTIKTTGIIVSFKGKLKLWKTQLMKGVLSHLPKSVQSRADGTLDASFYILYIDKLLKVLVRKLKTALDMQSNTKVQAYM